MLPSRQAIYYGSVTKNIEKGFLYAAVQTSHILWFRQTELETFANERL